MKLTTVSIYQKEIIALGAHLISVDKNAVETEELSEVEENAKGLMTPSQRKRGFQECP